MSPEERLAQLRQRSVERLLVVSFVPRALREAQQRMSHIPRKRIGGLERNLEVHVDVAQVPLRPGIAVLIRQQPPSPNP